MRLRNDVKRERTQASRLAGTGGGDRGRGAVTMASAPRWRIETFKPKRRMGPRSGGFGGRDGPRPREGKQSRVRDDCLTRPRRVEFHGRRRVRQCRGSVGARRGALAVEPSEGANACACHAAARGASITKNSWAPLRRPFGKKTALGSNPWRQKKGPRPRKAWALLAAGVGFVFWSGLPAGTNRYCAPLCFGVASVVPGRSAERAIPAAQASTF